MMQQFLWNFGCGNKSETISLKFLKFQWKWNDFVKPWKDDNLKVLVRVKGFLWNFESSIESETILYNPKIMDEGETIFIKTLKALQFESFSRSKAIFVKLWKLHWK
jgi:hypothetical protein